MRANTIENIVLTDPRDTQHLIFPFRILAKPLPSLTVILLLPSTEQRGRRILIIQVYRIRRANQPFASVDFESESSEYLVFRIRGRTGFDFADTPEAACRGWFVGLVNHRTKK